MVYFLISQIIWLLVLRACLHYAYKSGRNDGKSEVLNQQVEDVIKQIKDELSNGES